MYIYKTYTPALLLLIHIKYIYIYLCTATYSLVRYTDSIMKFAWFYVTYHNSTAFNFYPNAPVML